MNTQKQLVTKRPTRQARFTNEFDTAMSELRKNRTIFGPGRAYMPGVTRKRVRALARKMARVRMVEPKLALAR